MPTRIDTPLLDARGPGTLDSGKGGAGQGGGDAFGGVLDDLDSTASTLVEGTIAPADLGTNLKAGGFAMTATAFSARVTPPAAAPAIGSRVTTAAGGGPAVPPLASSIFGAIAAAATPTAVVAPTSVTPTSAEPASSAPISTTPAASGAIKPRLEPLPLGIFGAPAVDATADAGKTGGATATSPTSGNMPDKLLQTMVGATAGAATQAEDRTSADDQEHSRAPDADPTGLAAMLAMSAITTAPVAIATPQSAANVKSSSQAKSTAPLALSGAAADDAPAPATIGAAAQISDVEVETHLAVAAPRSVVSDGTSSARQAETKLEPAPSADALQAMSAPTRSVAQAVQALLPESTTPATAVPADPTTASVAPARTMTLQLNPANLGTVEVRLHLTGQSLDLQLSVSSKETLGLISRDRGHLETALAGQNYDLRSLVIQGAGGQSTSGDAQAGAQGQGTAAQGGQAGAGQTGSQNQGAATSGNGAGGNGERASAQQRGHLADETAGGEAAPASGAARAGGLFV